MQRIIHQLIETSWAEWLAFSFGVGQVVLAWLHKSWNFWLGLFSVCIYTFLYYQSGLYAESLLNLYYIFISIWGIFAWQSKTKAEYSIGILTQRQWIYSILAEVGVWLILYFILVNITDSTVPKLDALVSSLAWIGSWLLVKRKLENWLFLSVSNLLAIPLQWSKGLELTSLLTLIYLIVGVSGFIRWRKDYLVSLR